MEKVLGYRSLVEFFPDMDSPGLWVTFPKSQGKKKEGQGETLKDTGKHETETGRLRQWDKGRGWQRQKQVKPEDPVERGGVSGNAGSGGLWSQESESVTAKCGKGLGTPDSKREAWKVLSDGEARVAKVRR